MFEPPVSVLVRRPLVRIERDAPLREATRLLRQQRTRCLAVMDRGRLLGIFTDRDMVERCFTPAVTGETLVGAVMESPVVSVRADTSVGEALRLMDQERIRHLPLVDESGALVGLIRSRDLLEYIAEALPELILNQPPAAAAGWRTREGGGHG